MRYKSYKQLIAQLMALFLPFSVLADAGSPVKTTSDIISKNGIAFVENKGQIIDQNKQRRKDIDFRIAAGNVNIFVGDGALHYQWSEAKGLLLQVQDMKGHHRNQGLPSREGFEMQFYRMDVELVGADIRAPYVAEGQKKYREFYYLSQCPEGLVANSYEKIIYRNVYPNIDWVLYVEDEFKIQNPKFKTNGLKYDFVVHPGGNPKDIKLRYKGATSLSLSEGALTAATPMGTVTEEKPYSYNAESKAEVASSFVLTGDILSFDVAPQAGTLVIDPQLHWSRHIGGPDTDWGYNVAADPYGNGYLTGATLSQINFATFGSHQSLYGGFTQDGYLAKFDSAGLVDWVTYYGGSGHDQVNDIVSDKNGNIYFMGLTSSTDAISTSGAHQFAHGGNVAGYSGADVFLVKFNANGGRVWGTYYGDSVNDEGYAIECDIDGNVIIGGHTESRRFMASTGAFRTAYSGGFLAKFNPNGGRMWATYCGDTGWNYVSSIACDPKGNIYCAGSTTSYINIATSNSYQPSNGGGLTGALDFEDGFLMKFNSIGQRQWATYYGGTDYDNVTAVTCDDRGGVYIAGNTLSANGTSIATAGTHRSVYNKATYQQDAFVAKFTGDGNRVWGTYYGRSSPWLDDIARLKVLPNGSIFGAGFRFYPPGGPTPVYKYTQVFITRFDQSGNQTWFQDSICNYVMADMAYNDGKIYVAGTCADTAPKATFNTVLQGPGDGFVIRFFADTAAYIPQPFGDSVFCVGDTMKIPFDVTNKFNSGNVITLQMSDVFGSFANGTTLTTLPTDTGGLLKYVIPNTTPPGKGYRLRIIGSNPVDTSLDNIYAIRISHYPKVGPAAIYPICANGTLQMTDTGISPLTTNYNWTGPGGFSIATQTYNRPNVQITDSGWYVLTGDNYGCVNSDSIFVQIYPKPNKPVFTTNSPVCEGDTLKIKVHSNSLGVSKYNWAFLQGSSGIPVWYAAEVKGDTIFTTASLADTGRHVVVALAGGCPSDAETTKVVVNSKATPTVQVGANPGNFIGPWQQVTFSITGSSNEGTTPTYQWSKNGTDIPGATNNTYIGTTGLDLQTGDTICVTMTSNAPCPAITKAKSCIGMEIDLGVDDMNTTKGLQLYPNPNTGKFILQSTVPFRGEEVRVSNSLGQEVYHGLLKQSATRHEIDLGALPGGMYILHSTINGGQVNMRFTVAE